jgi:hypothetical protein
MTAHIGPTVLPPDAVVYNISDAGSSRPKKVQGVLSRKPPSDDIMFDLIDDLQNIIQVIVEFLVVSKNLRKVILLFYM